VFLCEHCLNESSLKRGRNMNVIRGREKKASLIENAAGESFAMRTFH
jgi:hypothetical protein